MSALYFVLLRLDDVILIATPVSNCSDVNSLRAFIEHDTPNAAQLYALLSSGQVDALIYDVLSSKNLSVWELVRMIIFCPAVNL
jgi:hypothetical protein